MIVRTQDNNCAQLFEHEISHLGEYTTAQKSVRGDFTLFRYPEKALSSEVEGT